MFSQNTLLTAKQGSEGAFVNWLKELGLEGFIKNVNQRAEALGTLPQNRWPNELGSRVYLSVRKIMLTIDT